MNRLLRNYGYLFVAIVITLMSAYLFPGIALLLIPLFVYIVLKDSKESFIVLTMYSIIMVIVFHFGVSLEYIIKFAGFGVLIGHLIKLKMNPFRTIMISALYVFFGSLISLGIESFYTSKSAFNIFVETYKDGINEVVRITSMSYADLIGAIRDSYIGITFFYSVLVAFILYFIIGLSVKYIYKEEMKSLSEFNIEGFKISEFVLFIVAIVLIKTYDSTYGELIFYSSILSLISIFAIQGFSSVYWLLKLKLKNKYVSILMALFFTFVIPGFLTSALVGFIDTIFNFRKV